MSGLQGRLPKTWKKENIAHLPQKMSSTAKNKDLIMTFFHSRTVPSRNRVHSVAQHRSNRDKKKWKKIGPNFLFQG